MCRSPKAVLASLRDTHDCIKKTMCFPFKCHVMDALSYSIPTVLSLARVVSKLCFPSEREISMCAYRAGTRKQKGHACRRQDVSLWGNLHNSMKKLVAHSNERTYRSKGS